MNTYDKLPYLSQEDFPQCEYGKAGKIRAPLREAINSARAQKPEKMEQVLEILYCAIEHITGEVYEDVEVTEDDTGSLSGEPADPLTVLLGPPKTEPDTNIS